MKITPDMFEAFLKCATKSWLRATGEPASGNAYAEWVKAQTASYRAAGAQQLVVESPPSEIALSPAAESLKAAKWRLASSVSVQAQLESCSLESELHAVERVPSEGRGRPAQFIPIRFVFTNKLGKDDKLLLAFDAFVLAAAMGCEIAVGKIIHGDYHATSKVKTAALAGEVRKRIEKLATLLAGQSPPDLVLNRHCAECEFQARCRQKAIEKDDLSLLAGMSAKERQKSRSKGIFTVTQLSYTFRPRRRPKRLRDKREKYHHSLKALAIREKKIHIVGSPELKIEGTPVYLDVEGLPDRDFYYLIGLRIGNGDSAVQHSLWADTIEDEGRIWREFLAILETVEKPVLIHYGSYETTFFKRMIGRHGVLLEESGAKQSLGSALNLLSFIFARIYFPGFSNSLKDVASLLGFTWTSLDFAGVQSVTWRCNWENSHDPTVKASLISYNAQDCQALGLVARTLTIALGRNAPEPQQTEPTLAVLRVEDLPSRESLWGRFTSPLAAFEAVNKAAQWDYQRVRIYVRTERRLRDVATGRKRHARRSMVINREIWCERPRRCPRCGRKAANPIYTRAKVLFDIRISRFGLRRWVVQYHYSCHYCLDCNLCFGRPTEFWQRTQYGHNLLALVIFRIIELCESQKSVTQDLNRFFGLGLHVRQIHRLKVSAARFLHETRDAILGKMLRGALIHADETHVVLHRKTAYVWVLTSLREVVYFYAESREADFIQKLLGGFQGVLVSDFYAAYDAIPCPQQKCLIHLMRDLNDELVKHPYDEEVRNVVANFGELLRRIVQTIDRRGLKRHFLRKHRADVDRFYRQVLTRDFQSEAALKCKQRFEKNRSTLFAFLDYDGVPWNNNNAEHAIKAFARLRCAIEAMSTPKGIEEYLILLSVCQTCKYMGVDFLDFLRSGEKDIHAFAENRRGCRRRPSSGQPNTPPANETADK